MPQELLDHAQVRPALEQVRREAVAQRVRVQAGEARDATVLLDDRVHALAREPPPADVEEDRLAGAAAGERAAAAVEVGGERRGRRAEDGDHALLLPLANHAEQPLVEQGRAQVEPRELAHAQPTAVEDLEDRVVAEARRRGGERLVEEARRLFHGEHLREALRLGGKRQVGGREGGAPTPARGPPRRGPPRAPPRGGGSRPRGRSRRARQARPRSARGRVRRPPRCCPSSHAPRRDIPGTPRARGRGPCARPRARGSAPPPR